MITLMTKKVNMKVQNALTHKTNIIKRQFVKKNLDIYMYMHTRPFLGFTTTYSYTVLINIP